MQFEESQFVAEISKGCLAASLRCFENVWCPPSKAEQQQGKGKGPTNPLEGALGALFGMTFGEMEKQMNEELKKADIYKPGKR